MQDGGAWRSYKAYLETTLILIEDSNEKRHRKKPMKVL
jgi:hypothetical protein